MVDWSTRPHASSAIETLGAWPNLVAAVDKLAEEHGDSYADSVERHVARLGEAGTPDGDAAIEAATDGYIEMTIETLRLQAEFYRTGKFSSDPSEFETALHDDPELMLERYLPGLYLAQVFWPNHFVKHRWFADHYLDLVESGHRVLDVGTGPGTFGAACLSRTDSVVFNDLSPHAKTFIDTVRPNEAQDFAIESFLDADFGPGFDHIIFSEVVEHLPDPAAGMDRLRDLLATDGRAFFSTATNAAFYDHTIVFETEAEIEELLSDHGFVIHMSDRVVATPGPEGRDVVDVNAVIGRRT